MRSADTLGEAECDLRDVAEAISAVFELVASTITCTGAVSPLRSFWAKPASISMPTVAFAAVDEIANLARVGELALHVEVGAGS
jgi:hypothetical protein